MDITELRIGQKFTLHAEIVKLDDTRVKNVQLGYHCHGTILPLPEIEIKDLEGIVKYHERHQAPVEKRPVARFDVCRVIGDVANTRHGYGIGELVLALDAADAQNEVYCTNNISLRHYVGECDLEIVISKAINLDMDNN